LAQKSLKIELQLNRYRVLKLQGLGCKIAGARFKRPFKTEGYTGINKNDMSLSASLQDLIGNRIIFQW
jgi:hypothetical protein